MGKLFECDRCGAELTAESFAASGWLVRHVWRDGKPLTVCPNCQRPDERRIVRELAGGETS